MFQDVMLKPLLTEESYTLHGKEAQHFFTNKLYTVAAAGILARGPGRGESARISMRP